MYCEPEGEPILASGGGSITTLSDANERASIRSTRTCSRSPSHYLTHTEVDKLIEAAKGNRQGHRDATMILLAYRHGLRASEVCDLRWDQVDFNQATLHVRRVKAGTPSTHPLTGAELRALRRLHREAKSPFVFVSERSSPLTVSGFRRKQMTTSREQSSNSNRRSDRLEGFGAAPRLSSR